MKEKEWKKVRCERLSRKLNLFIHTSYAYTICLCDYILEFTFEFRTAEKTENIIRSHIMRAKQLTRFQSLVLRINPKQHP